MVSSDVRTVNMHRLLMNKHEQIWKRNMKLCFLVHDLSSTILKCFLLINYINSVRINLELGGLCWLVMPLMQIIHSAAWV
jgi:hypothetical protein